MTKRILILAGPNGTEKTILGGHHIPDDVIRRRFDAGWKNFEELYKPLVDE